MFGILKKKLDSFSGKLKQTLATKAEESTTLEEKQVTPVETVKPEEEQPIKTQQEQKQPEKEKQPEQTKKEPEIQITPEKKEKWEEKAQEAEEKLFKEISKELGEEIKENKEPETKPIEKEEKIITQQTKKEEAPIKEENKGPGFFGRLFKKKESPLEKKVEKPQEEQPIKTQQEQKQPEKEKQPEQTKKEPEIQITPEKKEEQIVKIEEKSMEEELQELKQEEKNEKTTEEKEEEALQRMEEKRRELENVEIKGAEEDKRELKAKVGAGGKLKGIVFGGIEISEKDLSDLLWELELSLIESDVEQDAAHEITEQIKKKLVGQKVSIKNLDEYLKKQIKEILVEMMNTKQIDLIEKAKTTKPFKILMLGPNGAGKTTSIAKLAHLLQKKGFTVIFAAGDTFRSGAIDQLEEHANKLGVRVVKQQYGADPAAVAFDAIKAAEAGDIDIVIIDSAGRQETNKNLMEELKKLERVAKPDMKIYVGEAYAGQGLLEQAKEFDDALNIDGFILTKIDADAKGGTTISLLYKLKKPIIYIGTGQEYDDFEEFTPEFILKRII